MRHITIFMIATVIALFSGSLLTFSAYAAPPMTAGTTTPAVTHNQTPPPSEPLTDTNILTVTSALSGVVDGSALATVALTVTQLLTGTEIITGSESITEIAPISTTDVSTGTDEVDNAAAEAALDAQYGEIVEGAILANRTEATVRFFLEGETYILDPLRSLGLDLPRATAVMNFYNCDANTPETDEACYWDPYLLDEDGFYEIVTGAEEGLAVNLTLREAGAPSDSQVWIQNRSGKREVVVYRNVTYEIAPSSVQEFLIEADALPTFFLRSCVEAEEQAACEWTPVVVDPGFYYALVEKVSAGGLPGSTVAMLSLEPIVGEGAAEVEVGTQTEVETQGEGEVVAQSASLQILCTLQVPALNVRSGPGLEFQIVTKVRGDGVTPATVLVEGRNEVSQWLAVSEQVAAGGWITGNANYIVCDSDVQALPIAEVTDGRLSPTPTPVQIVDSTGDGGTEAVAPPAPGTEGEDGQEVSEAAVTPVPNVPEGLAMIIVNNGFGYDIRFTLDQKHRVEPGPSEYDLAQGESVSMLVYPGIVPFSASSPWNGLGDNAEIEIVEDTSVTLWLFFIPDPDGSGEWLLQY